MQACVIYRDHYNGPSLLTAVNDFVGKEDLTSITDFLSSVKAISNNDPAESVASGLQVGRTCMLHATMSGAMNRFLDNFYADDTDLDKRCFTHCFALHTFNIRTYASASQVYVSIRSRRPSMLLSLMCVDQHMTPWTFYTGGNQVVMEIQYQASDSLWGCACAWTPVSHFICT